MEIPFEVPRVMVFRWWMILVSVGTILIVPVLKWQLQSSLLRGLGLLWVIAILSSYLSGDWSKSISGNYYRLDGLATLVSLITLALVTAVLPLCEKSIRKALSMSGLLVGVGMGLLHFFAPLLSWGHWDQAISFTFGNPHFLGGYLVVTLVISLSLFSNSRGKEKMFWLSSIIAILGGLVSTLAYLYLILGMIGAGGWLLIRIGRRRLAIFLLVTFMVMFGLWSMRPPAFDTFEPEARGRIWRRAVMGTLIHRPLFGFGYAQVDKAIETVDWPYRVRFDVYVDRAHSSVVDMFAETGIVGLGTYLWIVGYVILLLARSTDGTWGWIAAIVFAALQLNVTSISLEMIWWIGVGLALRSRGIRRC